MPLLTKFPNIELAVMAILDRDIVALTNKSGTELPKNQPLPYVRVFRVPGGRRNRLKDYPWVDIEVFAEGATGKSLMEDIDAVIFGYPEGVAVGDQFVKIEDVQVRASLGQRPWTDDRVRRYGATYQLTVSRS